MTGKKLYLVVPCYNEEEIIQKTTEVLTEKIDRLIRENKIAPESRILFVNDGSRDNTLFFLHQATKQDPRIGVINFSANFGHQSAILAGMLYAADYADMVVTIDADLQQDIEALDEFIDCYSRGCDIVYGVRKDRNTDGALKKATATIYYKLLHWLGCNIITNHADYRLLSAKVIRVLAEYKEVNLFMRGLIPTLGFQSDIVYFDVKKREAGKSKYTVQKMVKLATDGITSLSIKPLRLITGLGLTTCLFGVFLAVFSLVGWIRGDNIAGYTTSILVTLIMNGVTLLSLGIIGEYIGKIYLEAKGRPRYIIDSVIWNKEEDKE
ncbi:MAG: glycosyltransferase family 2 protein [Lachnospiraceae bacterium]|nr:glycosyltransferase family 2 protein [Lachnospiraceae bacterium]